MGKARAYVGTGFYTFPSGHSYPFKRLLKHINDKNVF